MNVVKAIAWFLIFEFVILLFVFVITGTFSTDGSPLKLVADISISIGTTVWDIGIGFFIITTFLNVILMFFHLARGNPW